MTFNAKDRAIIDIGGSNLGLAFNDQLPKAFLHQTDFPKEVAYTVGMDKWGDVADVSYQTTDVLSIINATCNRVVAQLPSGTCIVDLGAANSMNFEPYVREFIAQGNFCTDVPLDISRDSLHDQIERAKAHFPDLKCVGLWGSFEDGDKFFLQASMGTARLFLSLGSIFYNCPDQVSRARLEAFRTHLSSNKADRLIVGQDNSARQGSDAHASYNTQQFYAFFHRYLDGIHAHAGITTAVEEAWSVERKMVAKMHYFNVTAKQDMVCRHFANYLVKQGVTYEMFKF